VSEGGAPRATLREVAVRALDALDGTQEATAPDGTIYARIGRPFALVSEAALEVRLEPFVAQAALRTPDTTPSDRGPDWVRFSPRALDRFAADRATAWIEHAWRHAASH
jgi:hypothetical protein